MKPKFQFSPIGYSVTTIELREVSLLYEIGHYLHRCRVGRQINYAIIKDHCLIGAICYALPMMKQGYFGLSSNEMLEFARLYLMRNTPGLAVWAMSQTLRRIFADWTDKFIIASEPQIIVSWHDTDRHLGTIYRAANFSLYKLTRPRKRGPSRYGSRFGGVDSRPYTQDDSHVKGTWLYPLTKVGRKLIQENIEVLS